VSSTCSHRAETTFPPTALHARTLHPTGSIQFQRLIFTSYSHSESRGPSARKNLFTANWSLRQRSAAWKGWTKSGLAGRSEAWVGPDWPLVGRCGRPASGALDALLIVPFEPSGQGIRCVRPNSTRRCNERSSEEYNETAPHLGAAPPSCVPPRPRRLRVWSLAFPVPWPDQTTRLATGGHKSIRPRQRAPARRRCRQCVR
jgi:hypothetical protein